MEPIDLPNFDRKSFNKDQQVDVNTLIIDDVMASIRQPFLEAGCEGSVLDILNTLWRQKLQIKLDEEPESSSDDDETIIVVQASERGRPAGASKVEFSSSSSPFKVQIPQLDGHEDKSSTSAASKSTSALVSKLATVKNKKKKLTKRIKKVHHDVEAHVVAKPETGARLKSTNPILLAANVEPRDTIEPRGVEVLESEMSKKRRRVLQIDGLDDTSDSDSEDLENDDDDNDDDDDDDDDDDPLEEEDEGAEEDPLGSGDDISDEDPSDLFNTENVVVCQYEKITRARNKWKFHLKDGIMNLNGRDYVFQRANGEAEW